MSEISEFIENTSIYEDLHFTYSPKYMKDYNKTLVGRLRHCFAKMKYRCTNPEYEHYYRYGGRGIKCLFRSSDEFINYVLNELKVDPRGLTIDRINNNGHYEPGNIRFVTHKENCNNRRKYYDKTTRLP